MVLLVYSENTSSRVEYIFFTFFSAIGVTYKHTHDQLSYCTASGPKLNYSSKPLAESEVWIQPVKLLYETGVRQQVIEIIDWNGEKAFFKTTSGNFPFDIFAASFYLLSRYEEYLPHQVDNYGRYGHQNSLAFKEGFLQIPLVNRWLSHLKNLIVTRFSISCTPPKFTFLPTYDIDIAYSYLHKGWRRNLGGFVRAMWNSDWPGVQERLHVLFDRQQDSFDSFEWLHQLHERYRQMPVYFFLLATRNSAFDKNILPSNKAMQTLVKQHVAKYNFGIHPSWQSGDKQNALPGEIRTLERLAGNTVVKSRQHYIRFNLPGTYHKLLQAGIKEDYSMGYGSINGFRASYCLPFKWYDLQNELTTSLNIYPFCFMDANAYFGQNYNLQQTRTELEHYFQVTKEAGGLLITIWHNHFLGTDKMFIGWRELYEDFVARVAGDVAASR